MMRSETETERRNRASDMLMDAADYFAETLTTADRRAWEHLLTYCPVELRAPSAPASPTGEELVEAMVNAHDATDLGVATFSGMRAALAIAEPIISAQARAKALEAAREGMAEEIAQAVMIEHWPRSDPSGWGEFEEAQAALLHKVEKTIRSRALKDRP